MCPFCASRYARFMTDLAVVCDNCGRESSAALWKSQPFNPRGKRKRGEDPTGMHANKGKEQRRLGTTGDFSESEHTVGLDPLLNGMKRGKSTEARTIENRAPAYQEEKGSHRNHPGTGNHNNWRGQGFSSKDYRNWQKKLVSHGSAGAAVQLNQLYYADDEEFTQPSTKKRRITLEKADDSFQRMVDHFPPVPINLEGKWVTIGVNGKEQAEMSLARHCARSQHYPTRQQEIEAMKRHGLVGGELEKKPPKSPGGSLQLDRHGVPKDGNCLFFAIWNRLFHAMPTHFGFVTTDDLRRMAVGFLEFDDELIAVAGLTSEYFLAMQQNGTWGGELEALALAYVWGVRITVHAPDYEITYNSDATTAIDIYYNGVNHYSIAPI